MMHTHWRVMAIAALIAAANPALGQSATPSAPSKPGERSAKAPAPAPPAARAPAPSPPAPPSPPAAPAQPAAPLGPPPPPQWSAGEIEEAELECSRLLKGLALRFQPAGPIRDGVCGAPAPISLQGLASEPGLQIRPAATVTCRMTAALHEWVTKHVQPRAKELLHANIVSMTNVASYHCRHRYDDPFQRMSNHAYAGALDISEFMTAKGERINVLEHWPLADERSRFLKEVHKGACQIFGTTLGPEANEAHKNHFHFDVQPRRKPFCDGVKDKPALEAAAPVPVAPPAKPATVAAPEAAAAAPSAAPPAKGRERKKRKKRR
ncbi:MAG: extensin family protein [Hyphomicrobiales bacterium]|nr:extensin family protein [Hyphomicrobiales bacterium]